MSNVLGDDKKQSVLALGRLGWSLRRIEESTGVRREAAGAYLKAAGIAVRGKGGRPGTWPPKPATTRGGSTDLPATTEGGSTNPGGSKPTLARGWSTQIWAELHERAFRRLGGTPRVIVLDNLAEGVLSPDIYDPSLNPLYRDVLAHYGAVALPCRVKDPDRKGKVEAGVAHAQKTPLKGLRFESLEQAQVYLDRWEERWADTRIHGTTKRQVAVMLAEEKPALRELPIEPFRYYRYGKRTVNLDGCIEVEASYYGAPPGWLGRKVHAQWDELHVRIMHPKTGQLLREHLRTRRGFHRIEDRDRPSRTPQSTEALLRRAYSVGSHIGAVCEHIHRVEREPGVRRILGVLALARKHGPAALEDAAQTALAAGAPTYRFRRRYLERRPPITLRQVDPLIRQLTLYRDLIDRKTGDPT